MKVRRVLVSIEVETDMTINEIKNEMTIPFTGGVWNVIQTQVNVIKKEN